MQYVVYGAGAIGGVVGARLHQGGQRVTLIARGTHLDAVRRHGLQLEAPGESITLAIPVVGDPAELSWGTETVVLLAVKGQDTDAALRALARVALPTTTVVCMQNGVENERRAIRVFPNTYGMCVMCPATHLEAGVVQANWSPITGMLDLGRFPHGVDDVALEIAATLTASTFDSRAIPDVMRWKYFKLLMNLGNALEALCGPEARTSELAGLARLEGQASLRAAGIDVASDEEDATRRTVVQHMAPTSKGMWSGGSSWQSLARSTGSVEADYLNGEIVLLGRLHGVPTPVNALLQRLANQAASNGTPPGLLSVDELGGMLRG